MRAPAGVTGPDVGVTNGACGSSSSRASTPRAEHPERGRFVADQVESLRRIDGVEVELFHVRAGRRELPERGARAAPAPRRRPLRRRARAPRARRLDRARARAPGAAGRDLPRHRPRARGGRAGCRGCSRARPRCPRPCRPTWRGAGCRGAGRDDARRRAADRASTSIASGRSRAPRRAPRSGWIRPAATCSSPPIPPGPRSATTAPASWRRRSAPSCWRSARPTPTACPLYVNAAAARRRHLRARGLRAGGARGARVRRARAVHRRRHRPAGAGRHRGRAVRAVRRSNTGAELAARHLGEADPRVSGRARASLFGRDRMARRVFQAYGDLAK